MAVARLGIRPGYEKAMKMVRVPFLPAQMR